MGFTNDGCGEDWFPLGRVSRIGGLGVAEALQIINESAGGGPKHSRRQGERIWVIDKAINIGLRQIGGKLGK